MIEHQNAAGPSYVADEHNERQRPSFEWPALSHAEAARIQAERAKQEQLHQEELERAWFEQVISEAKLQLETDPTFRDEVSAFLSKPFALLANPVRALGRRLSHRPPAPVQPQSPPMPLLQSIAPPKPRRTSSPPHMASPSPPSVAAPESPRQASSPPRVSSPPTEVDAESLRPSSLPPDATESPSETNRPRVSNFPARRSSLPPEAPVYSKLPTQQSLSPESIAELERYFASQPPPGALPAKTSKWSVALLLSGGAFGISLFVALTWFTGSVVNAEHSAASAPSEIPSMGTPLESTHSAVNAVEPSDAVNDIVVVEDPPIDVAPTKAEHDPRTPVAKSVPPTESRLEPQVVVGAAATAAASRGRAPESSTAVPSALHSPMQVDNTQEPFRGDIDAVRASATLNEPARNRVRIPGAAGADAQRSDATNAPGHRLLAPEQATTPRSGLRVYRRGEQATTQP